MTPQNDQDASVNLPVLGAGARDGRGVYPVAGLHPRRGPRARVSGNAGGRVAPLEVKRDTDHLLGLDLEVDRVGVCYLPAAYGGAGLAAVEGERRQGRGIDPAHAGLAAGRERDGGGRDGQVRATERVADLDANPVASEGHMQRLPQRRVTECGAARLHTGHTQTVRSWHWVVWE